MRFLRNPFISSLSILACLSLTAGLAACGDDKTDTPDSESLDTAMDTSIDLTAPNAAETTAPVCTARASVAPTTGFFVDVSELSGIRVNNYVQAPPVAVPINDHSRVAWADLNGDGFDDIVAHSLYPNPQAGIPFDHVILLNNGDGAFSDHSVASGLKAVQAAVFVFGDLDNDGDQDIFAALDVPLAGETCAIYMNDGQGVFTKRAASGIDNPAALPPLAANAMFLDYDGDAKLDLFVGLGHTSYAETDRLFKGNGDGTFNDVSELLQANVGHPTNGTVACDFDNDGDLDIFAGTYGVSHLLGANQLWQNDFGVFTDVAVATGFAANPHGNRWLASTGNGTAIEPRVQPGAFTGSNTFGVDCGDINNDGRLDVFTGNISHPNEPYERKWSDPSQVLINQGPSEAGVWTFNDQAEALGLPFNEGDLDVALIDFDNDGWLDLSLGRENKYEASYTDEQQKGWFGLMHQQAGGTFKSVGLTSGINPVEAAYDASLTACVEGDTCPAGEQCLSTLCRTPCTTSADCANPEEICHTGGFCRLLGTMKRAQNLAWSDYDGDGDRDLLVGARDMGGGRPNFLFRNDIGQDNRWLGFKLVGDGVKVNRDAIGARVTVKSGEQLLSSEIRSSRGLSSTADTRKAYIGLGDRPCGYTVEVRWPDGTVVTLDAAKIVEERMLTVTYPDQNQ